MRTLRRFVFAKCFFAILLGFAGGLLSPRTALGATGVSSGAISSSANGIVVRTQSGAVQSISYVSPNAGGEIAVYNWNATSPPASSLVWEGRVASANGTYNHTFQKPLQCSEGIVVQVSFGTGFIESE